MLKRKLEDGTVVGLSIESVQGGVLITLDNQPADSTPKFLQSFLLNPAEVAELIYGMGRDYCEIRAKDGRELIFHNPRAFERCIASIEVRESKFDYVVFPLRECEIRFIVKALENMADSLLFVGTWSGEPEEM